MNPLRYLSLGVLLLPAPFAAAGQPIRLHPANPHYFEWGGRPTVLITSGEHYGAVLNGAFEFRRYLATLEAAGLNLTRTFSGAYLEPPGAFRIERNTLAPAPADYICPWARSDVPGYAAGGNKFDLTRWNPAYFQRLHAFMTEASRRGVVVEFTLFCPMYGEEQWRLSPLNPANNVNGLPPIARTNLYTLDRHGGLLAHQEALTRKLVRELNRYDNLILEICNEPYFGGVTLEWQGRIAEVIVETEAELGRRHLISQNIANGAARVRLAHPAVSVCNFHYASPPKAVPLNYDLNRVIGDNETGFRGTHDLPYRLEAWNFILAGGGLFNHLDYSFAVGHEDGSFVYPATQPGGGNAGLRRQFSHLKRFIEGFDFLRMRPLKPGEIKGLPDGYALWGLTDPTGAWALHLCRSASLRSKPGAPPAPSLQATFQLEAPVGRYRSEWVDPVSGRVVRTSTHDHGGGPMTLTSPAFGDSVALALRKQ